MRHFLILTFILLPGLLVHAVSDSASSGVGIPDSLIFASANFSIKAESDQYQDVRYLSSTIFSLGILFDSFGVQIENFRRKVASGNSTLNLEREVDNILIALQLRATWSQKSEGYLSGGFGTLQEKVTTTLYGISTEDKSQTYYQGFAGAGLRYFVLSQFFLHTEARLYFGELSSPNPSPAFLCGLGVGF